jgi:sulfur-oxidizing protein SoxB
MDLDVWQASGSRGYRYRLLPVFSEPAAADPACMAKYDRRARAAPGQAGGGARDADSLLYRRGNFNGTFDQLIVDALRAELDAQISLSPGFRWGTTVLPGETITMDNVSWTRPA